MGIPYSRKIWWGIKFKPPKFNPPIFVIIIRMSIPYRTNAKFKSANILDRADFRQSAKF